LPGQSQQLAKFAKFGIPFTLGMAYSSEFEADNQFLEMAVNIPSIAVGKGMEAIGLATTRIPGVKQFYENLPAEDKDLFKIYMGSIAFGMITGTSGKRILTRDTIKGTFARDFGQVKGAFTEFLNNNASMTAVLDNFNENVIGLPSNLKKQRLALRNRFAGVEEYVETAAKNVPQEMFDGLQEASVAASKDKSKP